PPPPPRPVTVTNPLDDQTILSDPMIRLLGIAAPTVNASPPRVRGGKRRPAAAGGPPGGIRRPGRGGGRVLTPRAMRGAAQRSRPPAVSTARSSSTAPTGRSTSSTRR